MADEVGLVHENGLKERGESPEVSLVASVTFDSNGVPDEVLAEICGKDGAGHFTLTKEESS